METVSERISEIALFVDNVSVNDVTCASEDNTQKQEANEDEISDKDSIFGEDSDSDNDDEKDPDQTQKMEESYESDQENNNKFNEDEEQLLLSPASTKGLKDNSPFSIVTTLSQSPAEKKYTVKTEKKFKITAPRQSVVESEIQVLDIIHVNIFF